MSESSRFARIVESARVLGAAGYERAALAVATGLRSPIGGQFEHERDATGDPVPRFVAVGVEVGGVGGSPLLDDVDGDDLELHRRPLLGADQRDACVDRVE